MKLQLKSKVSLGVGVALVLALTSCGGSSTPEQAESPATGGQDAAEFDAEGYFGGKTIQMIVNQSAGGGTDILTRLIAEDAGDKIPGRPRVAITNKTGLGGLASVYDAPADDLVLGAASKASDLYTLILDPASTIDVEKIQVVGGLGDNPRAFLILGDYAKAHPTLESAVASTTDTLKFAAAVGVPADITSAPLTVSWVCDNLKLNCDMLRVAADGSADIDLMMERGEVNVDETNMTTVLRNFTQRVLDGDASVYFQFGNNDYLVVDTPEGIDAPPLAKDVIPAELYGEFEKILPLITGGGVGFTFFAGPNVPAGAVDVMRQAFFDVATEKAAEIGRNLAGAEEGAKELVHVKPLAGADAQAMYDKTTSTFKDSLPYYEEMQNKYWEQYWK